MAHPTVATRTYLGIYVALIALTLTTELLSRAELGRWEVPAALGIATVKTVLVALFFMHLVQSPRLTWLIVLGGVLFLGILLLGTLSDYQTRDWLPQSSVPPPAQTTPPPR